jgi:hypothetical protein
MSIPKDAPANAMAPPEKRKCSHKVVSNINDLIHSIVVSNTLYKANVVKPVDMLKADPPLGTGPPKPACLRGNTFWIQTPSTDFDRLSSQPRSPSYARL